MNDQPAIVKEVGFLTPRIVGGRVFHLEGPRKLNDLHPNLEGVWGMEMQFENIDLALWPCTLKVGLSKAERCSGLLPETLRKTVTVSLSFLFDVSVVHLRSCHASLQQRRMTCAAKFWRRSSNATLCSYQELYVLEFSIPTKNCSFLRVTSQRTSVTTNPTWKS